VAFQAFRIGASRAPLNPLVLAGSGGPLRTIVDSLNQFQTVSPLSINAEGRVLFWALRNDGRPALLTSTGGVLTPVPFEATELPGITSGDINDSGVIAFGAACCRW
jgi:hypothetical protein